MAIKSLIKPLNGNVLVEIQTLTKVGSLLIPNGVTLKGPLYGKVVAIDPSSEKGPLSSLFNDEGEPLVNVGDFVIISSKAEITVVDDERILVPEYHIVGVVIPEE